MTAKTTMRQNCRSFFDSVGATKFEVESVITYVSPGDLPTPSIFVYSLGTASDPKTDTFLRIGTIQDITTFPVGRSSALLIGAVTYLSAGFFVTYSDVATATTAKELIQSRVDELIASWHTYTTQFKNPDTIYFPLYDADLVSTLRNNYKTAKAAKTAADAAAVSAASARRSAVDALKAATEKKNLLQSVYVDCTNVNGIVATLAAAETTFRSTSTTFLGVVNGLTTTGADITALQAYANGTYVPALSQEQANLQIPLSSLLSSLAASCAAKKSALDTAAADEARANADLAAADRTLITATATAAAAGSALDDALNALTSACPTIDLTTI